MCSLESRSSSMSSYYSNSSKGSSSQNGESNGTGIAQYLPYPGTTPSTSKDDTAPKEPPPPPPPLDLNVYPPCAEFIGFGGATKHVLTNSGTNRMVFKVKCSNNSLFKVAPVYAFLDPGASMDLQVVRLEGPVRNDKLLLMYKEAKSGERDAKKAFQIEGVTCKKLLPLITREVTTEDY